MNALNLRQRQILAVGLLILAIFLLVTLLVKPLMERFLTSSETIDRLEHQMEIYGRVAAGLNDGEKQLQALRANNPVADLYLSETRPTLAAAQLQQHLNRMIGETGGQVVSTQILQKNATAALPTVAIQVHMRGEIDALVNLLYKVESGRPLLFMENLVVTAAARRNVRQRRVRAKRPQTQRTRVALPSLDIRFDLIGHSAKEGM